MKLRVLLLLVAVLLAAIAHHAAAAPPPDTIAVLTSVSRPLIALAPGTGIPHVAYVSGGSLYHAWKTSGIWNSEIVSDSINSHSTYGGFDLAIASDGRPVAVYVRNGVLTC